MTKTSNKQRRVYAVDLFCGAGGLTHGLERAGIRVKLGIDVDPACTYPYTENNTASFLLKSIDEVSAEELEAAYPKIGVRLLAGCAPCQTFSTYFQKASKTDERWHLLSRFAELMKQLLPDLVTMENVPRLADHGVFKAFLKTLRECGYEVDHRIVSCTEFGIPQNRQRLVLLASRLGPVHIKEPTHSSGESLTVRQVISDLPPIDAGEVDENDILHQCSSLSPLNLKRIRASKPGGSWRDWRRNLVAECHTKKTGRTYPSVYGRMSWDEPAPTITTQFFGFGNGRFGHPEQDRAISLREGALLQSFPPDYAFVAPEDKVAKKTVGRLIGNAVPVRLGEVIGESIFAHLDQVKRRPRKRRGVRSDG